MASTEASSGAVDTTRILGSAGNSGTVSVTHIRSTPAQHREVAEDAHRLHAAAEDEGEDP